jgi:hypothetical protein
MVQKLKFLSFVIVASLYIFLVPTTSDAQLSWNATHTPGETIGPAAHPPIPIKAKVNWLEEAGESGWEAQEECIRIICRILLREGTHGNRCRAADYINNFRYTWSHRRIGLGTKIRYIQYDGGYCYYYQGGISSGTSGPNTWRYDPN